MADHTGLAAGLAATRLVQDHYPDGVNPDDHPTCDCGWTAEDPNERWADHLVHVLAVADLLADPEQHAEPSGSREEIQRRLVEALIVADCVDDPAELGDTEEEFWQFMTGKAVMPVIDELVSERDALSLLLRAMARKLVAYRRWADGDVPTVHRLRTENEKLRAELDEMAGFAGQQSNARRAADRERDALQARLDSVPNILRQHYLAWIECDHDQQMDNPQCACSKVDLGWHSTVGDAVNAWIEHVRAALQGKEGQ